MHTGRRHGATRPTARRPVSPVRTRAFVVPRPCWYVFGVERRSSGGAGRDTRQSEARDDLVPLVRLVPTAWEANLGDTCREGMRNEERAAPPLRLFVGWSFVQVKVVTGDCAGPVVASSRFRRGWVGEAGGRVGNLAASTAMGMRTFAFVFDGS